MDEDKVEKTEEKTEEATAENSDDRDDKKDLDIIGRANAAAERLEEANRKTEELISRREKVVAKEILGGTTEGGLQTPKPEPISDKEFSEKVARGEINPLKEDGFI